MNTALNFTNKSVTHPRSAQDERAPEEQVPAISSRTANDSIRLTLITLLLAVSNLSAATVRYVWQDSPSPGPPYTTWATAAHVIQDAVNEAVANDQIVVTNGVYDTGGTAAGPGYSACRVWVNKAVALVSVNGPQVTVIRGDKVMYPPRRGATTTRSSGRNASA